MSDTKRHTPGEWFACPGDAKRHYRIETKRYNNDGLPIAEMRGPDREANARFIVRACNAHDDLLAACNALLVAEVGGMVSVVGYDEGKAYNRGDGTGDEWLEPLRQAVEKAEGGAECPT